MCGCTLRCLVCGADAMEWGAPGKSDLVALQEHLVARHGLTVDDLRNLQRLPMHSGAFLWRHPDGRLLYQAESVCL